MSETTRGRTNELAVLAKQIKIGSTILYVRDNKYNKQWTKGLVTKITGCAFKENARLYGNYNKPCYHCIGKVGIDGKDSDCHVYGGISIIKQVIISDFLSEDDFKI
jgi:hypothetical protein